MLFKHVGEFRSHATEHVKNIVDNMHDPELQEKDGMLAGIVPIPIKDLTEDHRVFLDEADQSLYFDDSLRVGGGSKTIDAASSMQPKNGANIEANAYTASTN